MAKINDLPLLSNPTEDMYCLVGKEDLQKVPWSAIMGQIGAPYIATTVAGMTDKTRVYVYQGSESGYTSGNWYYWNGSAWTSGGTYNSAAVDTDKTLTQSDKPADSAIVGQQIGQLKESLSNKITKFYASNQGETHITDSDSGKIQDMMIYGKSSQDGTPTPENPVEIKSVVKPTVKVVGANIMQLNDIGETTVSGITVSCEDGVIKAKGTTLKDSTIPLSGSGGFIVMKSMTLQNSKTYIYNPNPIKQTESLKCYLDFTNEKNLGISLFNNNINKPIKPTDSKTQYPFNLNIIVKQGTVVDVEWKPQLLLNESLLPYEPYKEQSIQLPITLNAIPVSSGGNVTIDGQQYIADYVDVERGKIVKCIEKYRISSDLNWIYEPSENDRFGVYGLNININPNFGRNTLFTHYQNKPNGDGGFIAPGNIRLHNFQGFTDVTNFKEWLDKNESYAYFAKNTLEEIDLTIEEIQIFKALATYYPTTNISVNSEQLDGYTVFNYPISMANGWNYVKQQLNDNRDYIYDMDLQSAEAYVNSEYAVALTELEV